jgi:hypothetical protein
VWEKQRRHAEPDGQLKISETRVGASNHLHLRVTVQFQCCHRSILVSQAIGAMPVAGINTGKELERDAKERISHQTGRNDADSLGFSHGTREQATVEREQIKAVNPSHLRMPFMVCFLWNLAFNILKRSVRRNGVSPQPLILGKYFVIWNAPPGDRDGLTNAWTGSPW